MSHTRDEVIDAVTCELLDQELLEGPEARIFADNVADRLRMVEAPEEPEPDSRTRFFDLRSVQSKRHKKTKRVGGRTVKRDPRTVDSVVVHQTAIEYGLSKRQIDAAAGDRDLALAYRGLNAACHAIAFRSGVYVATHPLVHYVNHGHGFNAHSLGLEIEGRYPGLMDDPSTAPREDLRTTWRGNPSEMTDLVIETACEALRYLVEEGRASGMPIRRVYAHRQSKGNRVSDPGQEIWERVVLGFAVPELGLETMPRVISRDGNPVPKEWDPAGFGPY